jgi:hypothetical protein
MSALRNRGKGRSHHGTPSGPTDTLWLFHVPSGLLASIPPSPRHSWMEDQYTTPACACSNRPGGLAGACSWGPLMSTRGRAPSRRHLQSVLRGTRHQCYRRDSGYRSLSMYASTTGSLIDDVCIGLGPSHSSSWLCKRTMALRNRDDPSLYRIRTVQKRSKNCTSDDSGTGRQWETRRQRIDGPS